MTGCWFALVTVISVLCSCSCRWMRLSFGCWRWSRNWSCFTARGTRLRMQLPCCRTLWTNSHRLESITIAPFTSLTFCVCDHSLFLFRKMLLKLQQKQDEVRHREELLQTFREQAEQSASKVCATVNAIETDKMQYLIVHNLLPWTTTSWKRCLWPVGTSGARTAVVPVGLQRGAERLPAADGGGEEELREWTAEEEWNGDLSHAARPYLNFTSFLLCFHVCWASVSPFLRLSPCRRSSAVPLWFAGVPMSRTFSCSFLCSSCRPCWRRVPLASPSWRRARVSCKHRLVWKRKPTGLKYTVKYATVFTFSSAQTLGGW